VGPLPGCAGGRAAAIAPAATIPPLERRRKSRRVRKPGRRCELLLLPMIIVHLPG